MNSIIGALVFLGFLLLVVLGIGILALFLPAFLDVRR